jgi:hypothetical protein
MPEPFPTARDIAKAFDSKTLFQSHYRLEFETILIYFCHGVSSFEVILSVSFGVSWLWAFQVALALALGHLPAGRQ